MATTLLFQQENFEAQLRWVSVKAVLLGTID